MYQGQRMAQQVRETQSIEEGKVVMPHNEWLVKHTLH